MGIKSVLWQVVKRKPPKDEPVIIMRKKKKERKQRYVKYVTHVASFKRKTTKRRFVRKAK